MKTTDTTLKKTSEFFKEISLDEKFWNEWTNSPSCFFSQKELTVINGFIVTGSHHHASMVLNMGLANIRAVFRKCKRRINYSGATFQRWLTQRLLEEHKIIEYASDAERFLYSPVEHLQIELPLKRKLMSLSDTTIHDLLLEYSQKDLKRVKGFGNKKLKDFKLLLEENNCLHLLKKGLDDS